MLPVKSGESGGKKYAKAQVARSVSGSPRVDNSQSMVASTSAVSVWYSKLSNLRVKKKENIKIKTIIKRRLKIF